MKCGIDCILLVLKNHLCTMWTTNAEKYVLKKTFENIKVLVFVSPKIVFNYSDNF